MSGKPSSSPDYSILDSIHPASARPRSSLMYQLSLLVVAITMVLLPLIYFALIGLLAYGVYYHATHHATWLTHLSSRRSGRGALGAFLIYITPIFMGCVVLLFMVKPLFAGRAKRAQPLALNPSDNPLLYAFIEKICQAVGAPSPARIDLDCELNASAGFRRGFLSMVGSDLVLTIGLPLVANLSAAEFGGVVAHEFGHFTQSVGMRLSYLIRTINHWFIRVVYERDSWDEAIEEWSANIDDARVGIIIWTTQFGVWFARMVLRVLMYIGSAIGGFMMRQMEYDADACQIRLVGSEIFERTHRKLETLGAAQELMHRQIHAQWTKTNQLPDNICELLRQAHESLPPQVIQKIEDASGLERTGIFDTHPCLADRVRAARRAQDDGTFHDDRPATALFTSFDHPARFVTLLHYTDDLDLPVTPPMLIRIEGKTTVASGEPTSRAGASTDVDDYFFGALPLLLPLEIAPPVASVNMEEDFNTLSTLRSDIAQVGAQVESVMTQFNDATQRLILAQTAVRLLESGIAVDAAQFGLSDATLDAAHLTETQASSTRSACRHSMHQVGSALSQRLQLGLAIKLADATGANEDSESVERVTQAVTYLRYANEHFLRHEALSEAVAVHEKITAICSTGNDSTKIADALIAQMEIINSLRSPPTQAARTVSALQIKVSKPPARTGGNLEDARNEAAKWFAEQHRSLEILVHAAKSVEGIGDDQSPSS